MTATCRATNPSIPHVFPTKLPVPPTLCEVRQTRAGHAGVNEVAVAVEVADEFVFESGRSQHRHADKQPAGRDLVAVNRQNVLHPFVLFR